MLCGEGERKERVFQCWKEAFTLQDAVPSMKNAEDVFVLHGRRASVRAFVQILNDNA